MAKTKTKYTCQECGAESPKWMGKCPGCHAWGTMVEEVRQRGSRSAPHRQGGRVEKATPITRISTKDEARIQMEINELNRVLGGGIVPASLILVGGDPGIGKSTLLLQVSGMLSKRKHTVLYISGEESSHQIKMRADRLGIVSDELLVLAETDMTQLEAAALDIRPKVIILDSIQTVYHPDVTSAPGSVSQVRECTAACMRLAKRENIAIFIVGHVTKEGAIAGPRMLEHMVDAVLYFEGDRHHSYRILRTVKNRFGSTNEMGIFDMREEGLVEVLNPSELFLADRADAVPGSTVVASMEGTRPVLVELQALVTPTSFGTPRRTATGVDYNRVSMIMAVLEKQLGMYLHHQDAYVNVAGGIKLAEPALDLGIAISIASSFRDQATSTRDVVIGEVGLTGEIRAVSRIEERIVEAEKLGFERVIVPAKNHTVTLARKGIEVIGVESLEQAIHEALRG